MSLTQWITVLSYSSFSGSWSWRKIPVISSIFHIEPWITVGGMLSDVLVISHPNYPSSVFYDHATGHHILHGIFYFPVFNAGFSSTPTDLEAPIKELCFKQALRSEHGFGIIVLDLQTTLSGLPPSEAVV